MIKRVLFILLIFLFIFAAIIIYSIAQPCYSLNVYILNATDSKINLKIYSQNLDVLYWSDDLDKWPIKKIKLKQQTEDGTLKLLVKNLENNQEFEMSYTLPYVVGGETEILIITEDEIYDYPIDNNLIVNEFISIYQNLSCL